MAHAPEKVDIDVVEEDHVPGSDEDEWTSYYSSEEFFSEDDYSEEEEWEDEEESDEEEDGGGDDSMSDESVSDESMSDESMSDESMSHQGMFYSPTTVRFPPEPHDEGCERCAVCFAKASVRCEDCDDEFYCGPDHRKSHSKDHKRRMCVPKGNDNASSAEDDGAAPHVVQDAPLATLPWEALLALCRHLRSRELLRLGWVCRRLRELSRDAQAWAHVRFGKDWEDSSAVLRVAPALRSLTLRNTLWSEVNLTRCTARVREFVLDCELDDEPYDAARLLRLLRHYQGHLQVVRLGCLEVMMRDEFDEDIQLLRAIDKLGIRELYVGTNLLKVYPGSSKSVTKLELGLEVGELVLEDALANARDTLTSFKMYPDADQEKNELAWGIGCVPRALAKCSKLEELRWPVQDSFRLLDGLPGLRSLSLLDFGDCKHAVAQRSYGAQRFFAASPVARGLQRLSLHLGLLAHRGLIQAVAAGCPSVRHLILVYEFGSMRCFRTDAPRDLHAILGLMGDLETLMLNKARVPASVFKGLAAGALPNLRLLDLKNCTVTEKGRAALDGLRSSRADLRVRERNLGRAVRLQANEGPTKRCRRAICRAASDCEDEDPLLDAEPDSDADARDMFSRLDYGSGSDADGSVEKAQADLLKFIAANKRRASQDVSSDSDSDFDLDSDYPCNSDCEADCAGGHSGPESVSDDSMEL